MIATKDMFQYDIKLLTIVVLLIVLVIVYRQGFFLLHTSNALCIDEAD